MYDGQEPGPSGWKSKHRWIPMKAAPPDAEASWDSNTQTQVSQKMDCQDQMQVQNLHEQTAWSLEKL